MQRKSALIGTDVERPPTSVGRCRSVVQSLVEKRSGLLSSLRVEVKTEPIDRELRCQHRRFEIFREQWAWRRKRKLLQLPHSRVGPLDDRLQIKLLREHRPQDLAHVVLRRPLRQ
jgi:hypothetical protein